MITANGVVLFYKQILFLQQIHKLMRHWKELLIVTLISGSSFGQGSVNYKVIKDTPEDAANYWINVGFLDMGLASKNLEGYGLLGASLNSVVNYKNKFGGEFTARRYYLNLSEVQGGNFEIGGYYHLFSKQKVKQQKVVLSSKSSYSGGKTYTETISMKVPGTIMRSFGIRAGFTTQKNGYVSDTLTSQGHGTAVYRATGLYAGILLTGQMNLKTHTSEYGIRGFGKVRRSYLDLVFTPVNTLIDKNTEQDLKSIVKPGVIGFRLGVEFLQPEPRKVQGNAMYQKFELGSNSLNGYYFMYSFGYNFKRKVKAMSSFKVVRETE